MHLLFDTILSTARFGPQFTTNSKLQRVLYNVVNSISLNCGQISTETCRREYSLKQSSNNVYTDCLTNVFCWIPINLNKINTSLLSRRYIL